MVEDTAVSWGYQKPPNDLRKKARVAADVKKYAVVVCNEDEVNPVDFVWKWGEDELPIVDLMYLSIKIYQKTALLGIHTYLL